MQTKIVEENSKVPSLISLQKQAYKTPTLSVYGSVQQLTKSGGATNGDGVGTKRASDRSLKENIVKVGDHPLGVGLYLFDYKPEFKAVAGYGRQFGVMADEVKLVLPEAIMTHPDGYMMVDYALLGISHSIH